MPRSCPPLRSDEVGWHGRRVSTRLRLILERVFWFVNGWMSRMFVGAPRPATGFRPSPEYLCLIVKGFQVAGA